MIEKIHEAHQELTASLLAFQKKYEASFLELKQVVSYSLDSISSPQPGTGTATPVFVEVKPKALQKAPPSPNIKPSNE